jgi:hypothetical protein
MRMVKWFTLPSNMYVTVMRLLEGRVKTITVRIDTKYCIAVTYVLEGRVNDFAIRIDTKHRITVTYMLEGYTDGEVVHSSF